MLTVSLYHFSVTAACTFLKTRGEVNLEFRIRQYNCTDITSNHDHTPLLGHRSLLSNQDRAYLWMRSSRRDGTCHLRITNIPCHIAIMYSDCILSPISNVWMTDIDLRTLCQFC